MGFVEETALQIEDFVGLKLPGLRGDAIQPERIRIRLVSVSIEDMAKNSLAPHPELPFMWFRN
jgi:hypothetical protein